MIRIAQMQTFQSCVNSQERPCTLGIAPEEAVFVDDMEVNVRGARRAGLRAIHFSGTDTYGHLRCRLRALGVPGVARPVQ